MYRVTVWIERVQTEILEIKEFPFLKDARLWCEKDFEERSLDSSGFVTYGGYTIDELTWKWVESAQVIRNPSLKWNK